jgi:four helix bundle protein
MKDFRRLAVWEKSHGFTLAIYQMTNSFPREEMFGLTSQIRRAASSIPTNIAEGCGRSTDLDFARFLQISFGSACEVEYHLILARDLEYITPAAFHDSSITLVEIKKMLSALIARVRIAKN